MSLRLAITQGTQEGQSIEFDPGSTVRIGRLVRGNTFSVKDSGVSSKHLSIESGPHGKWLLRDLESSNGTFLNGASVDPGAAVELRDGDCLKIGVATSISVSVAVAESLGPRRNPRRGRPARGGVKAEEEETDAEKKPASQRSRRLKNDGGSVLERIPEESEVPVRPPQRPRTRRGKRESEGDVRVVSVDEDRVEEDGARVVEEGSDWVVGRASGSKEVNLETMTLGEWFDILEADLPRQIVEATEEVIKGMRLKAQRVREYAAKQKKGKKA